MKVLLLSKNKVFQKSLGLAVRMYQFNNLNLIIIYQNQAIIILFQIFLDVMSLYNAPSTSVPPLTDVTNNT